MSAAPAAQQVAAFYRFGALNAGVLPALREQLQQLGRATGVLGTVLLAPEGVNGTISGEPEAVEALLSALQAGTGLAELELKTSWSAVASFQRLKVRLKREIVTLGIEGLDPTQDAGTNVPSEAWNALIDDPTTLVIDTRNAYEVAIGSFDGAIDPGTESFRDFPAWVEQELRPLVAERQPERLALFCTGGIRCEKATTYLRQQGFEGVHQLQGGILRYLQDTPEARSRWHGECYVFDRRVALNHRLQPGTHSQCHACGLPLGPEDRALESYVVGVSCRHCLSRFSDSDRQRFAERQRQMLLQRQRQRSAPVEP
nr:rhodanese-related sulfurtransferase [Cyanobium sp. Morenito 9A2]